MLRMIMNSLSIGDSHDSHSSCSHGLPPGSEVCHRVMEEIETALNLFYDGSPDNYPSTPAAEYMAVIIRLRSKGLGVEFEDKANRKDNLACLVSLGTKYVLCMDRDPSYWRRASIIAIFCVLLEAEPEESAFSHDLNDEITAKTILDLAGDSYESVRFFSKRIECECLKSKLEELKHVPKVGMCSNANCRQTKRRREMMFCSRCMCFQYCSQSCQHLDWPTHRKECKVWSKRFFGNAT